MSIFSKWSIGQRLGAGFALLMLMLAALVAMIAWQLAQNDRAGEALDAAMADTQRIDEFERSILLLAVSTRDALRERTPQQLDNFAVAERRLDTALRGLEASTSAQALVPPAVQYASAARRAVANGEIATTELTGLRQSLFASTRPILEQQDALVASGLQRMQANRRGAVVTLTAGATLTGLLFVVIAWLTARSVGVPARKLVGVATALRNGDWRPALQWNRQEADHGAPSANEMTQIGRAFGAAAAELEVREQRLAAHAAIANASGASLDRGRIADAVLQALMQHVHAEVGAIYVVGADAAALVPLATRCATGTLAPVPVGEGLVGQCARDRHTVVWRDIPPESPFSVSLGYDKAPPRSVAATPLVFGDQLLGVMVVASLRDLDDGVVAFLTAAASQVAVGLMNARAYEEVQALLDKLQLQSERIQAQNEELQAQNEEIQAQNEEIQAQNEELQAQGEEIQAQNEDLQRQTSQLHEQAGTLREADAHKNEFLGLLAHELRNPLTPISNCVELLSRRTSDPRAVAKVAEIVGRQSRHMTHLIDDLLDVTRVGRGKVVLKRERLNLIELVNQCMDDQRAALDQAGLVLAVALPDVPIHVDGDHTRICQVLANLLGNAIKFCPRGSTVHVEVTLDAPQRRVAIHVRDTGNGIEPALLSRIFEPFYQAESDLAHTKGGIGLGLALAKGLVELHGGRIDARSDGKGRGAEFVISLPLADAAEPPASASDAAVTPLTPLRQELSTRVLMIDDNADAVGTLAELLEVDGCRVEIAHSARGGIDAALRFCPDVILCDIGLPLVDGYAFAREVRQHPQLRTTLLVALTGYSSPADQQRAAEAGFDLHLPKPPDYARVVEILRSPAAARGHPAAGTPNELA